MPSVHNRPAAGSTFSLVRAVEIAAWIVAIAVHFSLLSQIPLGFYIDESSIAYNAALIAGTGHDEHGVAWPLFFEAFGEFKNPTYIYVAAAVFKLFGLTYDTVRLASATLWLLGTATLYVLCRRITADRSARICILIALAFSPWLFAFSRIAFEVIVLYPLLSIYLLAIFLAYEDKRSGAVIAAGIAMGVCLYSYSTFRLLAPLHVIAVCVFYRRREDWMRHGLLIASFALSAIPFVYFLIAHPVALTGRFATVTYLNDPALGMIAKTAAFLERYIGYFGPHFLLQNGDENLRHHTGFGGEALIATLVLALLGIIYAVRARNRFAGFLIGGLLLAPVAASLTADFDHSIRAFSIIVFLIALSCVGAGWLAANRRGLLIGGLTILAAVQATFYLWNYFTVYPATSARAFQNYDFHDSLLLAHVLHPDRIVIGNQDNRPDISMRLYQAIEGFADPWLIGTPGDVRTGDVLIERIPAQDAPSDSEGMESAYRVRTRAMLDRDRSPDMPRRQR